MTRAVPESALRRPLSAALGTDANVRVLRELSRHAGQLSAPDLAERTGLARTSVWSALETLGQLGLVESAGRGRAQLHRLAAEHPLASPFQQLFAAEEARYDAIRAAVADAARAAGPSVLSAFVYGSVARAEDRPGSDLDVGIVAAEANLARAVESVRTALAASEVALRFEASVVGMTPTDIARLASERDPWWESVAVDARVLFGESPERLVARARSEAVGS